MIGLDGVLVEAASNGERLPPYFMHCPLISDDGSLDRPTTGLATFGAAWSSAALSGREGRREG